MLQNCCTIITGAEHPAFSASLERFFLSVQYEMRAELTQENLDDYVHYYNFQRPHSALNGFTPACAWITGSKERFEKFINNTKGENREEALKDVESLVQMNYVKR